MAKEINLASGSFELVPGLVKKVADKMDNNNKILISRGKNSTSEPLPVQLATDMGSSSQAGGKPYPGFLSTEDIRAMSMKSVVVDAIVRMRVHQLAKLPIKIVPKEEEPSRQISILNYRSHDLDKHPAFDDADRTFLRDVYDRLDPAGTTTQKRDMFTQQKDSFSPKEVDFLKYLQEKHDVFYKQREIDIKKIKKVLSRPDPHFTNTHTWNNLMAKVLRDLLTLDRGIIVKIRDQDGNIVGLMPVDGASIRPIVYEYGFIEDRAAYVQNSRLGRYNYLDKKDVIVMMMNPVTDMRFFGYGISPLEVLSQVVLADIYIDKNNTDYYRKGGTVPEIILNLEPIPSKEGMVNMYSQSQVDAVQREITSIMTGDFTQVPIISGAKLNVTDLKGSRRDMQFKELAEYIMRKICAVFQVSSQEVNLLEGMKTSDGEVQADLTRSKGLHTLMMSVSEYLTYEVIEEMRPQGDLKLWFEEPEEKEADKNWGTQLKLTTGVLTINEVRSKMGLPPVPWGDTPLQNLQKNWEPTPSQGGAPGALPPIPGMGGPGGPPGAPPAPGGPAGAPPPPGGPAPSPFSGAGAPPTMKSVFDRVQELDLDRSIFSNADIEKATEELYLKSVKLPTVTAEDDLLSNIVNYKGGEFTRTPEQSVRYFLKSHNLDTEFIVDSPIDDTMLFSRIEDGVIIADESGETPIPLTIAKSLIASNPKGAAMYKGSDLEEALEFAVVEAMDAGTRGLLYENAYKYKPQRVSDAMIQEAKEIFLT